MIQGSCLKRWLDQKYKENKTWVLMTWFNENSVKTLKKYNASNIKYIIMEPYMTKMKHRNQLHG